MAGKKGKSGRPKKVQSPKSLMKKHLPVKELFDAGELKIYNSLVDIYLRDFEDEDLSAGDMDDVINLAINRVIEFRLLKDGKGNPSDHLNKSQTIERLRKQNQKIKENLANRRIDRGVDELYKEFSIVDLAVSFDEAKLSRLRDKENKLLAEEKRIIEERKQRGYVGNKDDKDREVKRSGREKH